MATRSPSIQSIIDSTSQSFDVPSLLDESLSLSSLSTLSSCSSIPPFPSGYAMPLQTILSIKPRSTGYIHATITVPTPPRLRAVPKDDSSVKKWMDNLMVELNAPGHTPWGDLDFGEPATWIPEGSVFSPDAFRKTISAVRRAPSPSARHSTPPRPKSSHRDALVFEREITLRTDGQSARWSVQVPARQMDPETASMVEQLQALKEYFKDSDGPTAVVETERPTPSLMISTSQFTMPLSLESNGNVSTSITAPASLATRRQKSPSPLAIDPSKMDIVYPGIPTAFLGSKDTPTFDSSQLPADTRPSSERSALKLQDMIGTLRSRCASLQVKTPPSMEAQPVFSTQQGSHDSVTPELGNEWAFADGLTTSFSPPQPVHSSNKVISRTTSPDPQDYSELLDQTLVDFSDDVSGDFDQSQVMASDGPPSSPLPPCPPRTPSPRGILKRCKSVRFASERQELEISADFSEPMQSPRHSTPVSILSKRAPTVRHTYAPKCTVIPPQNTPPNKAFLTAAGRKKPGAVAVHAPRAVSTPPISDNRRHTIMLNSTKAPAARSSQPVSFPSSRRQTVQAPKVFRHSALPAASPQKGVGKENGRSVVFGSLKSRFTLDENAMRKVVVEKDVTKSRMVMPLKNIFTRFK